MSPAQPPRRALFHLAESLSIGAIGGALFTLVGFPAGWLAGAMLFTAIGALAGRTILVPTSVARTFFIILGMSIGAVATPETLKGMATWPISIAMICIAMACATAATVAYLRYVHGWHTHVAVLAGVPGALTQVMVLATEYGVDLRGVAIVQTMRVVLLTLGLPAGLAALGMVGPARLPVGSMAIADAPLELAILVLTSTVAGLGLFRLGFSGGLIFGPMLASAVLHGTGFVHVTLPPWLINTAMVALGTVAGSRFTNTPFQLVIGYLGAAIGSFAVAVVVTAAFAIVVTLWLSLRVPAVVVAYAPGSVDVMMILALALRLDPVFVGAHHLARVFVVSLALPIVVRLTAGSVPHKVRHGDRRRPRSDGIDD